MDCVGRMKINQTRVISNELQGVEAVSHSITTLHREHRGQGGLYIVLFG